MVAQADPQLIFQRIIKVAGRMTENIGRHFRYELCGYPSSLFDTSGLFQEANKPILADSIWTAGRGAEMLTQDEEDDVICHVLDGGSIIHRLYHGKEMTHLSVFATAMLTMSTQAHQSHHTV